METTRSARGRQPRKVRRPRHDVRLLDKFFAQTAHPIIVLDREGDLMMANPAAIDMLGLPESDSLDSSWWSDAFHHSDVNTIRSSFENALRGGRIASGVVRTSDGRSHLEYETMALHGDADEVHAVTVRFDDVTEREERCKLFAAIDKPHEVVGSAPDMGAILDQAVDWACADLNAESVGILVKNDGGWSLEYASGSMERGHLLSEENAERLFRRLADEGMMAEEDLAKVDDVPLGELGVKKAGAAIAYLLKSRDEVDGMIIFTFRSPTRFTPNQIDYVRKAGAAASYALETSKILANEKREKMFLQHIIDHSPVNIALLRYSDKTITLVNAGFRQCIGDARDLDGILKRMPAEVSERIQAGLEHAHHTGEPHVEREIQVETPMGGTSYWSLYVMPQGPPFEGSLLVITVNITNQVEGRKRIEDLVKYADLERIRLKTVLETMPIPVMVVDRGGHIIVANEALRTFIDPSSLNISVDLPRLEGRWSDTGMKIGREEWPIIRALRGEHIRGSMTDVRTESGEIRTVIGSATPIMMNDANGAVIAFYDITDQRRAEQEALQAKRQMELYLDLLSHDVNNMNAGAKGYMELLLKKDELSKKSLHYARSACDMMDDIARLVENVRKLQMVEKDVLQRSTIDLNHLIDDIAATYRNTPSRHVFISFKTGEQAMVFGNDLLRDVFDNLIGNAIKHSEGDVDICISIGRLMMEGREFLRVDVTDTGPGIPDGMKEALFNRMQRGRTTAHGHGLGLYLAKTVLEMFGGRIWADDRVPGDHSKGSRFVALLPAAYCTMPGNE